MKSAHKHSTFDIIQKSNCCCCELTSRVQCTTGCPLCRSSWQGSVGLCPVWWSWIVLWWCVPYQTKDRVRFLKHFSWYSLLNVMNWINMSKWVNQQRPVGFTHNLPWRHGHVPNSPEALIYPSQMHTAVWKKADSFQTCIQYIYHVFIFIVMLVKKI